MPVYTYIKENENQHSDEAVALVEAAIQSVLNESLADKFSKAGAALDKAGAKVKSSAEYAGNVAKGIAIMGKEKAAENKARFAERKEAAKGARNVARSIADEQKAQRNASDYEVKLRKEIKALEAKKKKQGGELLSKEENRLNDLYDKLFSMEDDA